MINWNEVRASRPAKAACRAWIEQNLTDSKFLQILNKLGLKQQAQEVRKYLICYRHKNLAKNIRSALKSPKKEK